MRDASSTSTRLVLNLVGPSTLKSRGVGFNLKRGSGLAFATFSDGGWAHDTGVFQLKGSNPNFEPYAGTAADPVLFVSAPLASGDVLSTGIFQKDRTFPAKSPDAAPGADRHRARAGGRRRERRPAPAGILMCCRW